MSDVFERLKKGSAGHKAKMLDNGWLKISAHNLADRASVETFQPYALEAIEAGDRGEVTFLNKPHRTNMYIGRPYDTITLKPS